MQYLIDEDDVKKVCAYVFMKILVSAMNEKDDEEMNPDVFFPKVLDILKEKKYNDQVSE